MRNIFSQNLLPIYPIFSIQNLFENGENGNIFFNVNLFEFYTPQNFSQCGKIISLKKNCDKFSIGIKRKEFLQLLEAPTTIQVQYTGIDEEESILDEILAGILFLGNSLHLIL